MGIESTASYMHEFKVAGWAAMNTSGVRSITLPLPPNRLHGDAHRRERRGTEREGDNSRNGKVEARGPTCRVKCSRQRASKTSTIHLGGRVPLSISRLSCIARRQIPSAKTPMVAIGDGYGPEGVAVPGRERERRRVARGHRL